MENVINLELNLEQVKEELKNFEVVKRNLLKRIAHNQKMADFYSLQMSKRDISMEEYDQLGVLKTEYCSILTELNNLKGLIIWEF